MILTKIAEATRSFVEQEKRRYSPKEMRRAAESLAESSMGMASSYPFEEALKKSGLSFICEVKKASPSKGVIAKEFPYLDIAKDYEAAGADAISVLTEPHFFMGSNQYLQEIAGTVSIPVLRKDFTIDDYQIFQAKTLKASAVLLICALLDTVQLKEYIAVCDSLSLSALVEAHNENEIESALQAGSRIIGVNNRDLKTFHVDINQGIRLRKYIPNTVLFVAESGIKSAADIQRLQRSMNEMNAGVDGVLIGEALMRAENKKQKLDELRGESI